MPKKKIKLTPAQEQQEAALKEVEAILNMEMKAEIHTTEPKIKEKIIKELEKKDINYRNKKIKTEIAKKIEKAKKIIKSKELKEARIKKKEEEEARLKEVERQKNIIRLNVKIQEERSPYLVDIPGKLRKQEEEAEREKIANEDLSERTVRKYNVALNTSKDTAKKVKHGFFDLTSRISDKAEAHSQKIKAKAIAKQEKTEKYYKENISPQAIKRKINQKIQDKKEEVAKIAKEFENSKKKIPLKLLFKSIVANEKVKTIWSLYCFKLYNQHKKTINELAITSILTVLGFISFKIYLVLHKVGIITYKIVYIVGVLSYRIYEKTIGRIWNSKLVVFFRKLPSEIVNLFAEAIEDVVKAIVCIPKKIKGAFKNSQTRITQTKEATVEVKDKILNTANETVKETVTKSKRIFSSRILPKFILPKFTLPKIVIKYLPPTLWQRKLVGFAIVVLILIIPFKAVNYYVTAKHVEGKVLGVSEEAISSLRQAAVNSSQLDFAYAADEFSKAANNFTTAQNTLNKYSELVSLAKILPSKKAKVAAQSKELLASAELASRIGQSFSLAFASLQIGDKNPDSLTDRLSNFNQHAENALLKLNEFEESIKQIEANSIAFLVDEGAGDIVEQIKLLQEKMSLFKGGLQELLNLTNALQIFLGDEQDARYLIVFQNNSEMRASGGFIGSFAVIDFSEGKIKSVEAPGGGSYDLQGGLHDRFYAPQPLHLVSSLWEFHDANWWPDWPTSADKLEWFFENGWGSSVDGVIAISTTFAERFLKVIGPIDMTAKYGEIINSENFYDIVQTESENKKTNTPKEIIGDMIDQILVNAPDLITPENFFALFNLVEENLAEKHIMMHFNNEELQEFASARQWDGKVKDVKGDYLSVINTNIGGGKSDRKIRQTIDHQVEVMPDGSVFDTVIITREHMAVKNEPFSGIRNVNYLRLYVPKGSQLLEAEGFVAPDEIYFDPLPDGGQIDPEIALIEGNAQIHEKSGTKIYNEFDKTVFANWAMVDPGQTIKIRFKYKLPFKINSMRNKGGLFNLIFNNNYTATPYSLYFQKQAGIVSNKFYSELILPNKMNIVWDNDAGAEISDRGWKVEKNMSGDGYWSVIVE